MSNLPPREVCISTAIQRQQPLPGIRNGIANEAELQCAEAPPTQDECYEKDGKIL